MNEKVNKLEDLVAWQEAKLLAVAIYKCTQHGDLSKDFGLCNQLRKAVVSVPSNIAEGYGRGGNREFAQFLSIAKGSLYELKTQLQIASEIGYIDDTILNSISEKADKVVKLVSGLLRYLKESEYKGNKFAESEVEYSTIPSNLEPGTSN